MRRRSGLAGLVTVALVLLAGCGGSTPSGLGSPSVPASATSSIGRPSASPSPAPAPSVTVVPTAPTTAAAPAAPATPAKPTTSAPPTTRSTPASPSPGLPAALRGTDWTHLPTSRKVVALTFDGGASDTAVGSILATLDAKGVRATFFLTGDFARRYPAQARRIAAAGHVLGNHSNTHPDFTKLTNAAIRTQLASAEAAIRAAAGRSAKPLFRFPFGARTAADIAVVNAAGYVPIRWTVDTLGWKGTSGGISAQVVIDRVLASARAGQIVLMHVGANPDDGTTLDATALPRLIDALRARGYGFVTLAAML
jgi:peptidoglycan/xylan/chitin deacetylase (PgdA/CDA1 family)